LRRVSRHFPLPFQIVVARTCLPRRRNIARLISVSEVFDVPCCWHRSKWSRPTASLAALLLPCRDFAIRSRAAEVAISERAIFRRSLCQKSISSPIVPHISVVFGLAKFSFVAGRLFLHMVFGRLRRLSHVLRFVTVTDARHPLNTLSLAVAGVTSSSRPHRTGPAYARQRRTCCRRACWVYSRVSC
jgi:hypothetical protein